MIENTLGSLIGLMGFVWAATATIKRMLPESVPPGVVSLVLGIASTLVFWQAGVVKLDGADPATGWGWGVAAFYALFAVSMANKSQDTGKNAGKLIKGTSKGKI